MKFTRLGRVSAISAAGMLLLSSCAANEEAAPSSSGGASSGSSELSGTFDGSGASSQDSAQQEWIKQFQTTNPGVTINYSPDGSGAGREAFISGGVDYAGSDSALSDEELGETFAACADGTTAIDLPVYISPIAVIFNVEGVDELNLDPATIAGIFKGDITTWNDPAIAALNPDAALPSAPITAVHRSDDSGTTTNFTDYLSKNAPEVWDAEVDDVFPYGGEAAQGTSNLVAAVTGGSNTIGYADASRAGELGVAKIKVGEEFVEYSAEAAAAVVEGSPRIEGREENDIAIELDRETTDPTHYPLVLVSYLIACQEYADPEVGALVKAYASYVAGEGQEASAAAAGSSPLSSELASTVSSAIESIQ